MHYGREYLIEPIARKRMPQVMATYFGVNRGRLIFYYEDQFGDVWQLSHAAEPSCYEWGVRRQNWMLSGRQGSEVFKSRKPMRPKKVWDPVRRDYIQKIIAKSRNPAS